MLIKVHEAFKVLNDPYQRRVRSIVLITLPLTLTFYNQAYDTSLIRPDLPRSEKSWVQLDEEQIARMKDREEWAKQFAQRRKDRLNALDQARKVRESQRKARCEEKGLDYEQLKDMYLEELCRLNPEWQARKEQVRLFGFLIFMLGLTVFASDKTGA